MTLRAVLLADGPSDLPLADHLEAMSAGLGYDVRVTAIDPRRLRMPGHSVEDRLRLVLGQGAKPDVVFVHRDAEAKQRDDRVVEIVAGAEAVGIEASRVIPVVPVRMTEAWLLLDESEIRRVSGRPRSTEPLGLPSVAQIESVPDPKGLLRQALLAAGAPAGKRRRRQFERDFERHRRTLLQQLDPRGPVRQLPAWQQLESGLTEALKNLAEGR